MGFFVLGLNHKTCPVEIRERLHYPEKRLGTVLGDKERFPKLSELVILSTCNRVEWYGYSEAFDFPEEDLLAFIEATQSVHRREFQSSLYRYRGIQAMEHLFRVAAGLDSLVVGENEILGQVREAFRQANERGAVHSLLYRLMEKALKLGKKVRTLTKINEGAVSIPSVAVELAEKIFGRLRNEKVMVIGTGEMASLTLHHLRQAGANILYVVSRRQEKGEVLAGEFGASWISMEAWPDYLAGVDILISSTSASCPIVRFEQIKHVMETRRHRPLFLIDIAVPRDIESNIHAIDDVYLYNVDDLKGVAASNLRLRRREIQAAETLIEQAVVEYQSWLERLKARPALERFEFFLNEVLERELSRFAKEVGAGEPEKRKYRERIRAKLMHPPLAKIKEASRNGGVMRYLEVLHSLFDLDEKDTEDGR